MSQRVLLVAFKYPPYPEVGSHRWAKLSMYLAEQGWEIDVVTVGWGRETRDRMVDVTHPLIRIHRLPSLGPHRLGDPRFGTSAMGRFVDRIRMAMHRRIRRFDWASDARWWGLALIPAVARIVRRRGIGTIIATGGPFMAAYWASRAKRRIPGTRLVLDYRDPWIETPAVANASPQTRARLSARETTMLADADQVVAVTDGLAEILRGKTDATVSVISNGYDPLDVSPLSREPRDFTMMYAGNLSAGRQRPLLAFLQAVRATIDTLPGLQLLFYGRFPNTVRDEYSDLVEREVLVIRPRVSSSRIQAEISGAFCCLQFNAEEFPYLVSTKIYEYAAARRPVLSVNYGGEVDVLVREHELGWSVRADDQAAIRDTLRDVLQHWEEDPVGVSAPSRMEEFEHGVLAEDYAGLLTAVPPGEPRSGRSDA